MATVFGAREAALVREITKLYEEVRRAALPDLARHYKEAGPPRGEIVIVVAPPGEEAATAEADLDTMLREALATHSVRDAADLIATATGQPRRAVYARALQVSKDG
jgi:16S rRNA (cytidine1402-2'-O)-methyltransferase